MNNVWNPSATAIFVCYSDLDLQTVCNELQLHYSLPRFTFDEHSTWGYAISAGTSLKFNVTKTQRLDTIATWMPRAPTNVNYQIILFRPIADSSDSTSSGSRSDPYIEDLYQVLMRIFKSQIIQYLPQKG